MMKNNDSFKPVYAQPQSLAYLFLDFPVAHELVGDTNVQISYIAPLNKAMVGAFTFLSNSALREQLLVAQASVVVLSRQDYDWLLTQNAMQSQTVYAICAQPYVAYAFVAQRLYARLPLLVGIHSSAEVETSAQIAETAQIDARVVVGARAKIGAHVHVRAGVVIGEDVVIGDDTTIYPNVTIYHGCEVGARVIVHAGAVIGSDGFGNAPSPTGWQKIPQVGRVIIGDDVEIGANTTIDRGALVDTVIHNGVKLDNQIQIAHNCEIGEHTAIASCVGIAGSTKIGARCMIGGAAMIGGHLTIADGTVISGGTAVLSSITEAGQYTGVFPPMLHRDWERNASLIRHLSDLRKRLRALEKSSSH